VLLTQKEKKEMRGKPQLNNPTDLSCIYFTRLTGQSTERRLQLCCQSSKRSISRGIAVKELLCPAVHEKLYVGPVVVGESELSA
jgi:hypothetical protein